MMDGHTILRFGVLGVLMMFYIVAWGSVYGEEEDTSQYLDSY